jgi:hypothetical protein
MLLLKVLTLLQNSKHVYNERVQIKQEQESGEPGAEY